MGWLGLIWGIYSSPEHMVRLSDWPWVAVALLVVVAITLAFMATIGRRISRRSSVLAAVAGGFLLPTTMIVLAFAAGFASGDDYHGGGMIFLAMFSIGLWTAPISLATSILYVLLQRRRTAS